MRYFVTGATGFMGGRGHVACARDMPRFHMAGWYKIGARDTGAGVALPRAAVGRVAPGAPLLLGIRPEAVRLDPDAGPTVEGDVEVVEPLSLDGLNYTTE